MLISLKEAFCLIETGKPLFFAAQEALLAQLPKGNWIGGTIPYFMAEQGALSSEDKLFVTQLPDDITVSSVQWYLASELARLPQDASEDGFCMLIIPATSPAHLAYAQQAPSLEGIFLKPIIGWISGVHLRDLGTTAAKVFNGQTGESSDQYALAMHLRVPEGKLPSIGIVNLFRQGQGDSITFESEGFVVQDCLINGQKQNLAEYLLAQSVDTKLPLVANYCGTRVNVSFQSVDAESKTVVLYAPVFRGVEYKVAAPLSDYVAEFEAALPKGLSQTVFSCNCILNYLYSNLEGKKTAGMAGPITFGEIAYQLLNQTLVYLELTDA